MALVVTASRKAARGTLTIVTAHYVRIPMPLTVTPIFHIFSKKIVLSSLGQKKIQSVAFIWGVAFINPKKYFEVYALIRSVAFIRVLLVFVGGVPPFGALFGNFVHFQ